MPARILYSSILSHIVPVSYCANITSLVFLPLGMPCFNEKQQVCHKSETLHSYNWRKLNVSF